MEYDAAAFNDLIPMEAGGGRVTFVGPGAARIKLKAMDSFGLGYFVRTSKAQVAELSAGDEARAMWVDRITQGYVQVGFCLNLCIYE